MIRRAMVLTVMVALAACGRSPTDARPLYFGSYDLTTVSGRALPALDRTEAGATYEATDGRLVLQRGAWREQVTWRVGGTSTQTTGASGHYAEEGTALIRLDDGREVLVETRGEVTILSGGRTRVYARRPS